MSAETAARWLSVCLVLIFVALCSGQPAKKEEEDIFQTPCIEANVTIKYGTCFRHEVDILSDRKFRSESECLKKYRAVASCIRLLGEVCDNGERANNMRFLFHEYNIEVAGMYACKNLYKLRSVLRCVSRYGRYIGSCRDIIWYSYRMAPFLDRGSQGEKFCWNMGVVVHCRQLYARRCQHHLIYFRYLFSVYPSECQALPWVNQKTTKPPVIETPCTLNNFVDKFNKCFNLERVILDASVNTTDVCQNRFKQFRACTDKLYKSCVNVEPLAKIVKQYVAPEKMVHIADYACRNLDAMRRGLMCMNQFKSLIQGCVKTKQQYQTDNIKFLQKVDPERAACLVINVEYRCRIAYQYKCQNEMNYFHYLDLLYPTCTPTTRPTNAPTMKCSLATYEHLYMKCMARETSIILDIGINDKSCKSTFYELSQCLMDLYADCKGTNAEKVARAMADPLAFSDNSTKFACDNIKELKVPAYCLVAYQQEVADCVTNRREMYRGICHAISLLTYCEREIVTRHRCNKSSVYFVYKAMLLPPNCDKLPKPIPSRSICTLTTLYHDVINCLKMQIDRTIYDKVRHQNCRFMFMKARKCFSDASKLCTGDLLAAFKAVFAQRSFDNLINLGCSTMEDIKMVIDCTWAKRGSDFDAACTATTMAAPNTTMAAPNTTMAAPNTTTTYNVTQYIDYFCRLSTQVTQCYRPLLPDCDDKSNSYRSYLDAILPLACPHPATTKIITPTSWITPTTQPITRRSYTKAAPTTNASFHATPLPVQTAAACVYIHPVALLIIFVRSLLIL